MTNISSSETEITQNANNETQQQTAETTTNLNNIQITQKQIEEQRHFLQQFSGFSSVKQIQFLTQRFENKFKKTTKLLQDFLPTVKDFYEFQIKNADYIRKQILSRLSNLNYSMDKLDVTSDFLRSYSAFRTFCVTSIIQLDLKTLPKSSHNIFEQEILLTILKSHRLNILNSFYTTFKLFPLVRRREILSITAKKLCNSIEKENSLVFQINNSNEHILNELSRLSHFFNIDFDLETDDGQRFIYSCETVLGDYQRHHFSFQQIPIKSMTNSTLNDCINTSFMATHNKHELLVEAFENILNRNERYHVIVYNAVNNKSFPSEQIQALIDLRFCRNRQLFAELETSANQLFEYKHRIEQNLEMNSEVQENEVNYYISFIVEEILIFGSAVIDLNNQKVDLDPLLEFSLERFVKFTNAKLKLLSIFCEISRHSNSSKIHEYTEKVINKRPNLVSKATSFFEKFDIQIEVLEQIAHTLNLLLNLHIICERQITSFLGPYYEPFQFGSTFSTDATGDFNLSYFEVYPMIEKLLDFFSISDKIVDDLCSTFSINSIEYRDYIEFSVWSQLLNELNIHPEMSLFAFDYSTIHFNAEISKDVESLIECKLLDDPVFIKQFFNDNNSNDFAITLLYFIHLASKLRFLISKTNILLPTYLRQFDEAHSSINTTKTIEFFGHSFNFTDYENIKNLCMKGEFNELIEIIESQQRYISMLMIAIQYNNFRSDNYYTSFLFNLESPNNYFFITKEPSRNHETKTIKLLHEAAKRLFTSIDDMMEQDFSAVFYDISDIEDFRDPLKLISNSKSYLNRIELAVMTNYERTLLSEFQPFELFILNEDIVNPINNSFNYLSIPQISQCLNLDSNEIEQILRIVSVRLNLIGLARFESFLSRPNNKFYELLNDHQNIWESNFFSKLNTTVNLNDALKVFESMQLFQMTRLNLGVLLLIQKVFQTKRAIHLPEKEKPTNLSLISDDEIRHFWKTINNVKDTESLYDMMVIERYLPTFISNLSFSCSDIFKHELCETMVDIDLKVERNVMDTDSSNYVLKCCEYMKQQIVNEFMKFAYLRLMENIPFQDLTPLTIIDIKRKQYKQFLPFYTTNVVVPASQRLPEEKIPEVEIFLTDKMLKMSTMVIINILDTMQKQTLYSESLQIEKELLSFQSLESPMKPECYSKKKTLLKSEFSPYTPNPEDANRQFEQETNYANSKITRTVSNFAKEIEKNNSLDLQNPKVKWYLDTLQSFLSHFYEQSQDQTLKTWVGYSKNMRNVTFQKNEDAILLNDLIFAMKQQFNYYFKYELSVRISDSYLLLSRLRDKEKGSMHDQIAFEKEVTAQIRQEYDSLIHDLNVEKIKLLKRFQQIHDQYYKNFENAVNNQKEKGFQYIDNFAPNHEIATQSLEISKDSAQEMEQIKLDELKQHNINKEREEERQKQERRFEAEAIIKSKNLPSIDIDAMKVTRPQTPLMLLDRTNPRNNRRLGTLNTSSSVSKFSSLETSRHHRRRVIHKSQTMASFFEDANEPPDSSPKFTPKKHTGSLTIQKSMELLIKLEKTQKEELEVKNNKKKNNERTIDETKTEIAELRKQIMKERIVKCLFRIATERHYNKQINVISDDKREASIVLRRNRKVLEEITRQFNDDLADCFKRLGRAENEIDSLKQDLEAEKAVTTKLAHWKDLNLRSSDEILKKIGIYEKGPNVDVNKLLQKLEAKREELDLLNEENDEFENQLEIQIREPMEEISRIRRIAQQQQYQNYRKTIERNQKGSLKILDKELEKALKLNTSLKRDNENMKKRIAELEQQKLEIPPLTLNTTADLMNLDHPLTGRRRVNYMNANRGKTSLTARSPYASLGYRAIIKPIA